MRNAIREYIDLTDDEKKQLWNSATFVFDTNVFLNLYRYSKKTRDILLKAMHDLGGRIWMPHQVAYEFMRKRSNIIHESNSRYDVILREFIDACKEKLRIKENDPELGQLKSMVEGWIEEHRTNNIVVTKSSNDRILDELLALFDGKTGKEYDNDTTDKIKKEGKDRYAAKIPPGYKDANKAKGDTDNNAYGDLFVWKQIIDYAKQNSSSIIFVTHDQKEDWWEQLHGKTIGPRVELRKEFYGKTGGSLQFHMYSMEGFISQVVSQRDTDVIEEVKSFNYTEKNTLLYDNAKKYIGDFLQEHGNKPISYYSKKAFLNEVSDYAQLLKLHEELQNKLNNIRNTYSECFMPYPIRILELDTIYELKEIEEKINEFEEQSNFREYEH